ncbi:hypothetical protein E6W39_22385 [Kitasatospora acidiphila]|uniref:Uncharacterized protein n=1 Tax=Kitasatospora acidiphila TaxID=2567942 RepID=A0A540W624_9ACTN|nr:hypothetical protein [Kitasatospora acidiphila]TQF04471.1 hypothetical protein E6W39_22385 [Kitasatospora acidiphila]
MSHRTWKDLRQRLHSLSDLGDEMRDGMDWGRARFLFAITALMAADAASLANDLETELLNLAMENGIDLPPLELGGDA